MFNMNLLPGVPVHVLKGLAGCYINELDLDLDWNTRLILSNVGADKLTTDI